MAITAKSTNMGIARFKIQLIDEMIRESEVFIKNKYKMASRSSGNK